eukprot:CAMPEP_0183360694 /NCGR_PEP_ID=MMETSP0164_2-20130417/55911_1 /TAXON_ID=221442 /ORGANISM="Coccolithus pelagicus ssp braarudi, Strain PLY182g" /LENGTH=190 /DNA_ID=CAMNT_0025535115 /DNA_START=291 /DNA_END=864 /DNA_ORIENTATION=-
MCKPRRRLSHASSQLPRFGDTLEWRQLSDKVSVIHPLRAILDASVPSGIGQLCALQLRPVQEISAPSLQTLARLSSLALLLPQRAPLARLNSLAQPDCQEPQPLTVNDRDALNDDEKYLLLVALDLVVDLRAHAAGNRTGEEVGDEVNEVRSLTRRLHEDGNNVEYASNELQAVGTGDDLIVKRLGPDVF